MFRLPPLIALRVFEAAARHGSFKLAADELGVTPTAVSHQVSRLEEFCGQRLFRRRPRPLALTAAGEDLFPVLHDGFSRMSTSLAALSRVLGTAALKVTTTSAFAARWLMPRLPAWRQLHPEIRLDVISTYDVLDLGSGEADIAIRYAREVPSDGVAVELFRDQFCVVGNPALVGQTSARLSPEELARLPRIETGWPPKDTEAPTWQRWERQVRKACTDVPKLAEGVSLRFEEELHAIEAAIAGQGIAICSDVLVGPELASGKLRKLSDVTLPGYGFYLVHAKSRSKDTQVQFFLRWAQEVAKQR